MELTLFVIVGAVAILSAAMMLISENAVYSALFLILNFMCIAFFFLMLNAPFLAMVQISVYAGAIMVLFLFVIMLLGAERVAPTASRFRWMVPAAVVLALVFLVAAGTAIIQGEIDLTAPKEVEPYVRTVNVVDGAPAIDVYLNDDRIAETLAFQDDTAFHEYATGSYRVSVFAAGADPGADSPLTMQSVVLESGQALSLVVIGRSGEVQVVAALEDVSRLEDKDSLRVVAINALPEWPAVDLWDNAGDRELLVENVVFGEASDPVELPKDTYAFSLYPHGDRESQLATVKKEKLDANTTVLLVFSEQRQPDNSFVDVVVELKTNTRPSFGGPENVGQLLFSRYVLPFEMVALLLLVAMIGAIVLTHETLGGRRRMFRRLANPPTGLEQPEAGK